MHFLAMMAWFQNLSGPHFGIEVLTLCFSKPNPGMAVQEALVFQIGILNHMNGGLANTRFKFLQVISGKFLGDFSLKDKRQPLSLLLLPL